jgi:hypothetical protein
MRTAEFINLVYFSLVTLLAILWRLPRRNRLLAILTGMAGLVSVFLAQSAASWIRDWMPAPVMVMAYRQAGFFFQKPRLGFQAWLQRVDAMLFKTLRRIQPGGRIGGAISVYFELVYFLCYPLVPGGLLALYFHGLAGRADTFWSVVLPSAYACYVIVPFLPMLPPRMIEGDGKEQSGGVLRGGNLTILDYASIGANTFPSGHVAASVAVALVLMQFVPVTGALFMFAALSIGVGCVVKRYHYAMDSVLGALVAYTVFAVSGSIN